ncbi:MAG: hypothetical protein ACRDVE_12740, partial [Actinocrinis sp.]
GEQDTAAQQRNTAGPMPVASKTRYRHRACGIPMSPHLPLGPATVYSALNPAAAAAAGWSAVDGSYRRNPPARYCENEL